MLREEVLCKLCILMRSGAHDMQVASPAAATQLPTPTQRSQQSAALTMVQQENLRNMIIWANAVAPGNCLGATLAAHALTQTEPMDTESLQKFAVIIAGYWQQHQQQQLQQQQ